MATMADKSQTTSDPVRRWTLIVLGLIVVLFLYSLIADRLTPYTSQATVQAFVVRMAPEVAGRVIEVNVIDNQRVEGRGCACSASTRNRSKSPCSRRMPNWRASAKPSARAPRRLARHRNGWSRPSQARQRARTSRAASSSSWRRASTPKPARTRPRRRSSRRGRRPRGRGRAGTRQARARPAGQRTIRNSAKRSPRSRRPSSISFAPRSRRPTDGVVTNLQLTLGQFVAVGQAALTFIDARDVWINANFRENSLENIKPDAPVEVVLDVLPGRIFAGKVQSVGWGVSQGSIDPATGLPKIGEPMGLVRNPQRFTVKIDLNGEYCPGHALWLASQRGRLWRPIIPSSNALGAVLFGSSPF